MGIEETILEELKREGREGEFDPKVIEEFVDACFEAREQEREIVWDLSWSESIFELWNKAEELGMKAGMDKGHKEGFKEGREEGREEGFKKGLRMAAESMLAKGFSPDQVAGILLLSLEEDKNEDLDEKQE